MAKRGMVLRSGAADGADTAFEQGCDSIDPKRKQIFLPWNKFSDRSKNEVGVVLVNDPDIEQSAAEMAAQIHPAWERLSQGAKKLHSRNVYQVLGPDMKKPSRFLICWAPLDKNGDPKGGTRTAVLLAQINHIRSYNLAIPADLTKVTALL